MTRWLIIVAALLVAGCASVSTEVVPYNPAVQYPPTASAEVLLQKPARPHVEIGLIEVRGASEATLLNAAREQARVLGAHAIVKLETERVWHEPVPVYDPWYDPFYWGAYRWRPYPPFSLPVGPVPLRRRRLQLRAQGHCDPLPGRRKIDRVSR